MLLILIIAAIGCNTKPKAAGKELNNYLVGTWHLTTKGQNLFHKGVIIYSVDGQMSVILNHKDSAASGYSGKYEVNEKESYVKHYRDFYSLLPFKFGESAMIMPDSTPVVINSVSIVGNAIDYSIKYVVRTKKGEYLQISPSELRK